MVVWKGREAKKELLGSSGSGEKGTPVLRLDLTRSKSQIGDRRNSETMRRVEQGEERRRAAVLQEPISIAVADFGFFAEGELFGGYM